MLQLGQHPPASRTIVHLSDTHLVGGGRRLSGTIDADANLVATLERVERLSGGVDALVFTGDLADLGEPEAYVRLRELVDPVAARLGAPVVWVAGNHDERPELRRDLLGLASTQEPLTGVWDLGGLRLVALDSTVPGWHHGDLDDAQLAWLAEVLAEPAPLGTVLALHHPPLPSHIPLFDVLELRDQGRLAAVIAGSDVRAILAGHLHYSTSGTFAGVPVSVASASCYTMDISLPAQRVNGMDAGQSFHLVHVYEDTITHSVVPIASAEPGDAFTPAWYAAMAALTPEQRLDAFSRKPS
ncbi:phosphodiesterase [Microbacterium betulae]|uniref:Phosphodiesterase n=1 Tax=Microbacterium betulae TaxID=2981139 RepID=A0AA97FEJ1_9MICO|nr:phosphodiesterase [Microbacterium sp. AB]WOF22056.1 phosphodiesterase [Microbacterium sp. AB]